MEYYVWLALAATLGTWFVTALGAATVVFFKSPSARALNLMLGFSAGVMIAASFWSLLQPAIQRAEAVGNTPAWLVAVSGFLLGALFLWGSDKAVCFARTVSASSGLIRNSRMEATIPATMARYSGFFIHTITTMTAKIIARYRTSILPTSVPPWAVSGRLPAAACHFVFSFRRVYRCLQTPASAPSPAQSPTVPAPIPGDPARYSCHFPAAGCTYPER